MVRSFVEFLAANIIPALAGARVRLMFQSPLREIRSSCTNCWTMACWASSIRMSTIPPILLTISWKKAASSLKMSSNPSTSPGTGKARGGRRKADHAQRFREAYAAYVQAGWAHPPISRVAPGRRT